MPNSFQIGTGWSFAIAWAGLGQCPWILVKENVIWFGTANGISRYDGRWQTYTTASAAEGNAEPVNLGKITALISQ